MHSRIFQITPGTAPEPDLNEICSWMIPEHADYVDTSEDRDGDLDWFESCTRIRIERKFQGSEYDVINISVADKMRYFAERFLSVKKKVEELTLEKFSTDNYAAWLLAREIDEKHTYYVVDCYGAVVTFDEWLRNAEPGRYYIGAIFDYHF